MSSKGNFDVHISYTFMSSKDNFDVHISYFMIILYNGSRSLCFRLRADSLHHLSGIPCLDLVAVSRDVTGTNSKKYYGTKPFNRRT